ncbi:MAG: sensor histidine kinase, partial [Actinomycetota bacterium]|nr:sensor histidine kinase [Actinomycetota bacterium]
MIHDSGTRWASSRALRPSLVALGATAAVLIGVAAALLGESVAGPFWVLMLFPLVGVVYVSAGLVAWLRRPANRFGGLLVLAGLVVVVSGLQNTDVPVLRAVGTVIAVVPIAAVVHLLLAFPSGRVRGWDSRVIVVAAYSATVVLQAPAYLFASSPPPDGLLWIASRPDLVELGSRLNSAAGIVVLTAAAAVLARRLL